MYGLAMIFFKKLTSSQRGDTIMEVLIAVGVLGFMLASAFTITNRNQLTIRDSQERSEGVKIAEKQIESLRSFYSARTPGDDAITEGFCFKDDGSKADNTEAYNNSYSADCSISSNGYNYQINIWPPGTDSKSSYAVGGKSSSYAVTVRWDAIKGGTNEVKLFYAINDISLANFGGETATGPGFPVPAECNDVQDNDGDGRANFNGLTAVGLDGVLRTYPPDPGCTSLADTTEGTAPTSVAISETSHRFASWHLYNSGGVKPSRTFTATNTTPDTIATVSASLNNDTDFDVVSNSCNNRQLSHTQSCSITISFAPRSGGGYNRYAYAGLKQGLVTVSNNGFSQNINISGITYSDRLGPGDGISNRFDTDQPWNRLVPYNVVCYSNVEACGGASTGIVDNGNLYLGNTYCSWGGWGGANGNYPTPGGNYFVMQTDGNLVFYGRNSGVHYASWTNVSGNYWLQVQDLGGGVYITDGSGGSLVKWIHYGGSCFAW